MALSPNGKRLAAGTISGQIKMWDTFTYQEVATIETNASVWRLAFIDENTISFGADADCIIAPSFDEIREAETVGATQVNNATSSQNGL